MEVAVSIEGEDLSNPAWGRWPVLQVRLCSRFAAATHRHALGPQSHATFVALDVTTGRPLPVAPTTPPRTGLEAAAHEAAGRRREARLARRALLQVATKSHATTTCHASAAATATTMPATPTMPAPYPSPRV